MIQKADQNLLTKIKQILEQYNPIIGRIASGDIWNKNKKIIKTISEKHKTICEDMESVAIYTVSNQYKIPAMSIKIISNNEILEEPYTPSVAQKLQKITEEIIKKL